MLSLSMAELATTMRRAAVDLLDSLPAEQRHAAWMAFDPGTHRDWSFFPGERPGVRLAALGEESYGLALDLLATVHSDRGRADAALVVRAESIRRELAQRSNGPDRADPYRDLSYWLLITGKPRSDDEPWSWRISGHHLLAQATIVGSEVAAAPHFFGAEPATVLSGPHSGLRALPREEDLARELVLSLQEDQRREAVTSEVAPAEIKTRFDPVAVVPPGSHGIAYDRLDRPQRDLLVALLRQYVDRVAPVVANQAWADLTDAGLENVAFGWAGRLERGGGHYYALTGPTLLIEYDNTQDDANHIHSVWRDLRRDFADDVLRRHYASAAHEVTR